MRKPEWKQSTPQNQLVVQIMAAQGHLMNVIDGVIAKPNQKNRLQTSLQFLEDTQYIIQAYILNSRWIERSK